MFDDGDLNIHHQEDVPSKRHTKKTLPQRVCLEDLELMITLSPMQETVLIDTHDVPSEILVCVHDKLHDKTEICPRSSEYQARCPNLYVAMEL